MAFNTGISYAGPLAAGDVGTPNQGNSMYLQFGLASARPSAGNQGVLYYATDTGDLSYDSGSAWVQMLSAWRLVVRKTADETVNNSSTLQNDDALLFAIAANEVWAFTAVVFYRVGAEAADIKFAVTGPTGSTGSIGIHGADLAIGGGDQTNTHMSVTGAALATGIGIGGNTTAVDWMAVVHGVVANGANAGNVQIQWAQNAATVIDTVVKANSFLIAHRVA